MENLTLEELRRLLFWFNSLPSSMETKLDVHIQNKIQQAIKDLKFEEKRLQF